MWHSDAEEGEVILAEFNNPCASFCTGFSSFPISIVLCFSVFIGLSNHINCHFNTATCDVHGWTNALFIVLYRSHSMHNVTLRRIENLNSFSIRFFCSHSAHNVMTWRIDNLNGLSTVFYRLCCVLKLPPDIIRLPTIILCIEKFKCHKTSTQMNFLQVAPNMNWNTNEILKLFNIKKLRKFNYLALKTKTRSRNRTLDQ